MKTFTFEEALSALEAIENGAELVEAVKGRLHTANNEAKNLRDKKKELETKVTELDGISQWAKKVAEKTGIEVGTEISDDFLKGAKNTSELERTVNTMKAQLQTLTGELANEKKVSAETTKKARLATAKGELTKHLGDKVVASDFVINGLIHDGKVKVSEDDKLVFVDSDGKELDFHTGINEFLKSNPDIVKDNQKPGGGTAGSNGKPPAGPKQMSRVEFEKLPPREGAKLMTSGAIQLTD